MSNTAAMLQKCHYTKSTIYAPTPLISLDTGALTDRELSNSGAAELQQRRGVGHALAAQIDANEAAQRGAVEQCVLSGLIGQL